jgi:putative ABC transport system substrate-binding protein
MTRRQFITLLSGASVAGPLIARASRAQSPVKRHRIGYLAGATYATAAGFIAVFISAMKDEGYVEGRDFDMVYRFAEGQFERLPSLARELVVLMPDVIVTPTGDPAALAARSASTSIPIVSPTLTDPVRAGLVASFARPGGNITGVSIIVERLPQKQAELALQVVPGAKRLGVLLNLDDAGGALILRQEMEASAGTLQLGLVWGEVRVPDELEAAIGRLAAEGVDALVVLTSGMFVTQRQRIVSLAAAARLPDIYTARDFVVAGGLISYGTNLRENFQRAAAFVAKIFKGASPADLPIEFPTKLELGINLKTAKALGLTLTESLLLRADEVIE